VHELLGWSSDEEPHASLSDGGHFENLGLYEMVRRRCRFILVSDAGCDPNFQCGGLANAVRKIAIDLGIQIRFHGLADLKPRLEDKDKEAAGAARPYHAIGQ